MAFIYNVVLCALNCYSIVYHVFTGEFILKRDKMIFF